MNRKEAIELLKTHNDKCSGCDKLCNDLCKPAVELAIKALEKQIPKKPVIKPDKYTDVVRQYYCPNCGRYFGQAGIHNVILFNKERFCQEEGCGQAIDWNTED